MGLFKRRKSRATRRAEARAIKAKAKLEARLSAKNEARRYKSQAKAEARALKSQLRAQRESDRTALKVAAENIPGVKAVKDHLVWIEPASGVTVEPEEAAPAQQPRHPPVVAAWPRVSS